MTITYHAVDANLDTVTCTLDGNPKAQGVDRRDGKQGRQVEEK